METKNVDFYTDPIQLQRRTIDPKTSNWVTLVKNQRSGKFSDRNLVTSGNVYEYRMLIPDLCKKEYESLPHNSILLMAEKDSVEAVETVNLAYNSYKNWPHGVLRYELWQKVDDGDYVLLSVMKDFKDAIEYNNIGFNYYFRTKAIENVGKHVSWSNTAYVEFVPKVKLYNVITPNNDKSNDFFVIDGIENYPNNLFTVFNRYGKTVFTTSGYQNTWAGTDNEGAELSTGVYFYSLDLNDIRPKEKLYKGSVSIVK